MEAALAYSRGMLHFIVNFDKRPWWQRVLLTGVYVTMHAAATVMDTLPVSTGGPVKDGAKMPLIVFSHGLAGHRNMYAVLCSALASQGYIVAAMEHRDGSASCASVVDADGAVRHKAYVHTEPPNFDWRREQIVVARWRSTPPSPLFRLRLHRRTSFPARRSTRRRYEARLMSRGSLRWVTLRRRHRRRRDAKQHRHQTCRLARPMGGTLRRVRGGGRRGDASASNRGSGEIANVRDELASLGRGSSSVLSARRRAVDGVRSRRHKTPGFQRFAAQVALFGEDHGYEGVGRFTQAVRSQTSAHRRVLQGDGRARRRVSGPRGGGVGLSLARTTERWRFGSSVRRRDEGINGGV